MKFLTTASSVAVAVVPIMMASSDTVDAADDFTPRRLPSLRLRSSEERELQDFWAREMIADIDSMIISHAPNETPTDSLSTSIVPFTQCFGADDGGRNGVLYNAIRQYVSDGCANNPECDIGKVYGWPMNLWCVGNVIDMSYLFQRMRSFDEDISGWETGSATDMTALFNGARLFNGDLSKFDTSSVTSMRRMFEDATVFNGDLSNFNTSSVIDMGGMFNAASLFNQDLSNFDTSSVIFMNRMFADGLFSSSFNGNVLNFDTSSVVGMGQMFNAVFKINKLLVEQPFLPILYYITQRFVVDYLR